MSLLQQLQITKRILDFSEIDNENRDFQVAVMAALNHINLFELVIREFKILMQQASINNQSIKEENLFMFQAIIRLLQTHQLGLVYEAYLLISKNKNDLINLKIGNYELTKIIDNVLSKITKQELKNIRNRHAFHIDKRIVKIVLNTSINKVINHQSPAYCNTAILDFSGLSYYIIADMIESKIQVTEIFPIVNLNIEEFEGNETTYSLLQHLSIAKRKFDFNKIDNENRDFLIAAMAAINHINLFDLMVVVLNNLMHEPYSKNETLKEENLFMFQAIIQLLQTHQLGLVNEAVLLIHQNRQSFKNLEIDNYELTQLIGHFLDKITEENLKRIRNNLAFHFDEKNFEAVFNNKKNIHPIHDYSYSAVYDFMGSSFYDIADLIEAKILVNEIFPIVNHRTDTDIEKINMDSASIGEYLKVTKNNVMSILCSLVENSLET